MVLTEGLKNDLEKEIQRRVILTKEEIDHEMLQRKRTSLLRRTCKCT